MSEALEDAADATENPRLLRALTRVRAAVREGRPLADALGECPDEFPALYRELVRASEAAGALGPVLARLAAYLERTAAIRARLRTALAYPAVMALAVTAVLVFLLTWVLPQMAQLFAETGAPLPLPTRALLLAGTIASRTWIAWVLVLVAAAVGLRAWLGDAGRTRPARRLAARPAGDRPTRRRRSARPRRAHARHPPRRRRATRGRARPRRRNGGQRPHRRRR